MPIDITSETVISLAEAAQSLPGRPSITTLWRWYARGVKGIKLETAMVGGKRFTSREAVQRFSDALTGGTAQPQKARSSKQRQAAIERAERELSENGI